MFPIVPPLRPPLTEQEYLERQVAESRQAIQNSLAGLKTGARQAADLQAWAKRYPWGVVGVAAAAGLAAATAFLPRKKQPVTDEALRERLSRLLDVLENPLAAEAGMRGAAPESSPRERASMLGALRRHLLAVLKAEVLAPVLAEAMQAGAAWGRGSPVPWGPAADGSPAETEEAASRGGTARTAATPQGVPPEWTAAPGGTAAPETAAPVAEGSPDRDSSTDAGTSPASSTK